MATMADLELGFAHLAAMLGPCSHADAVPVESLAGETVAWLCPSCDIQLPVGWRTLSSGINPCPGCDYPFEGRLRGACYCQFCGWKFPAQRAATGRRTGGNQTDG